MVDFIATFGVGILATCGIVGFCIVEILISFIGEDIQNHLLHKKSTSMILNLFYGNLAVILFIATIYIVGKIAILLGG